MRCGPPDCGRWLTRKGQDHSYGIYTEDGFLEGTSERAVQRYETFKEGLAEVTPYELAPAKTRMASKGGGS